MNKEKKLAATLSIIVITQIVFAIVVLLKSFNYPYSTEPIIIRNFEDNASTKVKTHHTKTIKTHLKNGRYFSAIGYFLSNHLYVSLANKIYTPVNNLTTRVQPLTLFTSQHIFGLYGFRIEFEKDGQTIVLENKQVFDKDLNSARLTNRVFSSRYFQANMYVISNASNKLNMFPGYIVSDSERNAFLTMFNFYDHKYGNDYDKIRLIVRPINNVDATPVDWKPLATLDLNSSRKIQDIQILVPQRHPYLDAGIPKIKDRYDYGLYFDKDVVRTK